MPPKNKFSKEDIIQTGLNIVRQDGFSALTARTLSDALSSSTKPIFGLFANMKEVHLAVLEAARQLFDDYIHEGLSQELAFKGVGMQYIRFAKEEPKLFQILFMSGFGEKKTALEALPLLDQNYETIISSIRDEYGLGEEDCLYLYQHLWIYSHGIATLMTGGVCHFTDSDIDEQLKDIFLGLLIKIKSEKND